MANTFMNFNEQLKGKGYKVTNQRKIVLDVISENQGKHLIPDEIYNLVRTRTPNIGIATVYRTLSLLEKLGLIYKVELVPGIISYEMSQMDMQHKHHHLICLGCGDVIEVKEDLLENLEEKIALNHDFLIKDHILKFYGYCPSCRADK
jgi:Fe2+/Zn2+ uptake regulation proteins